MTVYFPKYEQTGTEAYISWDVAGYYMYLPAAFVYDDLAGDSYHDKVTTEYGPSPVFDHAFQHESGVWVMKYSLGQALQFAPFFAVAHAFAKTSAVYPADGFSLPYQLSLAAEVVFFALLSLVLLRRLLRHYYSEAVTAAAIIAVGVATNYLEYSSINGAHTHLNLFVWYTLLILATRRFYLTPSFGYAAAIGACIGIAALSRPTELMMLLVPLLWAISLTKAGVVERAQVLANAWPKLLVAAVVGGAILSLQPLYWHSVSGDWIVYSYQDQGFSWIKTHFTQGLASFKGGWLPYTPLGILMLLGFIPFRKQYPRIMPGVALYLLLFMYVVWSWDLWQYGGSLGQRTMVQVYPLLALPLAALFEWTLVGGVIRKIVVGLGFGVSLFVSLYWMHAAHYGGFAAGEMTTDYYWALFPHFDEDRQRGMFLDRVDGYDGTPRDAETLFSEGFETVCDEPMLCAEGALTGAQSLCVRDGDTYSKTYAVALPTLPKDWIRVSFDLEIRAKTWDSWAMAQVMLLIKQDDEIVESYFVRPERLLDDGRQRVTFNGQLPRASRFNRIELQVWKPGLNGLVLIDEVEVVGFDE